VEKLGNELIGKVVGVALDKGKEGNDNGRV